MTSYPDPFISERADPFVTFRDGWYYFTASYPMRGESDSEGYDRVILRKSASLAGLADAEEKTVWKCGENTMSHRFIWAPELHRISGRWYIFYAGSGSADNVWDIDCRVLECSSDDPYSGIWNEKGKMRTMDGDDFSFRGFSLDMTWFECRGQGYVIWAQHDKNKISCLYIASVDSKEPWRLTSMPMLLSYPEYDWERVRFAVNEAPAVLQRNGMVFVSFSASGTGAEYCMGLLAAKDGSELLKKSSWRKRSEPFIRSEDLIGEYGPGHNSFTVDENGRDMIVYHSRGSECFEGRCGFSNGDPLYDPCRHARIRPVFYDENGFPTI